MTPAACLNDVLFLNRAVTELWGGSAVGGLGIVRYYHALVPEIAGGAALVCDIDEPEVCPAVPGDSRALAAEAQHTSGPQARLGRSEARVARYRGQEAPGGEGSVFYRSRMSRSSISAAASGFGWPAWLAPTSHGRRQPT